MTNFYITTPIYYVNDRPHIGHFYTTIFADVIARYHRMVGDKVLFLTGTDEHSSKTVNAAAENNVTPREWADKQSDAFKEAFEFANISYDIFARTSDPKHIDNVQNYIKRMIDNGFVYKGVYEGWYDQSQEEYISDSDAEANKFKSVITDKPLEKRQEDCYYFKLSALQNAILDLCEKGFIYPEGRLNEVRERVKLGLRDIPISRLISKNNSNWGIPFPGDVEHIVWVWADAIYNYFSFVDNENIGFWPADVHLIAKDILWFHAVIWPAMTIASNIEIPKRIHSHSFWIRDGKKMSKSLGNFVGLDELEKYAEIYGIDAVRYYLAVYGPAETTDRNFSESHLQEIYNADLANTIGNCLNRVLYMVHKAFKSDLYSFIISYDPDAPLDKSKEEEYRKAMSNLDVAKSARIALSIFETINKEIDAFKPFNLINNPETLDAAKNMLLGYIANIRLAATLLHPIMPDKSSIIINSLGELQLNDNLMNQKKDFLFLNKDPKPVFPRIKSQQKPNSIPTLNLTC